MRDSDWKRIQESKDEQRTALAALPFDEKLQLLERLRDRARAFQPPESRLATNSAGGGTNLLQSANGATVAMTIAVLGIALMVAAFGLQAGSKGTVATRDKPGSRT